MNKPSGHAPASERIMCAGSDCISCSLTAASLVIKSVVWQANGDRSRQCGPEPLLLLNLGNRLDAVNVVFPMQFWGGSHIGLISII